MASADEDIYKKKELEDLLKEIGSSTIHENRKLSGKKRKMNEGNTDCIDEQLEKYVGHLEETTKQIELVKKALNILYDMEKSSFSNFISKSGELRSCVSRQEILLRLNQHAKSIPLWIGKEEEVPPPLCGAVEADADYIAEVGDMVAALVKQDEKDNWILAEVTGFDPKANEFTIDDVFEDQKMEETVSRDRVIPLPKMRADPESNPEALFPKSTQVLALYPQTTCFYHAVVSDLPKGSNDPYQLIFQDNVGNWTIKTEVDQYYVIPYKNVGE